MEAYFRRGAGRLRFSRRLHLLCTLRLLNYESAASRIPANFYDQPAGFLPEARFPNFPGRVRIPGGRHCAISAPDDVVSCGRCGAVRCEHGYHAAMDFRTSLVSEP